MADEINIPVASGGVKFTDLLLAGAVKYGVERALMPVVGNGTLVSGAVKLGAAWGSRKFLGQKGEVLTLALGMDAAEDLVSGAVSMFAPQFAGGQAQNAQASIQII
jgi:hypothetical protein